MMMKRGKEMTKTPKLAKALAQNEKLREENEKLREENEKLREENEKLRAELRWAIKELADCEQFSDYLAGSDR